MLKMRGLVLARKAGSYVRLKTRDGNIDVAITRIQKGRAMLLIDAPLGVQILRDELLEPEERKVVRHAEDRM